VPHGRRHSQDQLGAARKLDRTMIAKRIERGVRRVDALELAKLSRFLGRSLELLPKPVAASGVSACGG